jgi:hypothetical protein
MTHGSTPTRHWRSYGTEPPPTGQEALEEPPDAFPTQRTQHIIQQVRAGPMMKGGATPGVEWLLLTKSV